MAMRDVNFFLAEFEKRLKFNKRHAHSNMGYGGTVMPILNLYASLSSAEERDAFEAALIRWLTAENDEQQEFAVNICLGFFRFRDAIGR